ncbi:MAG: metal-sulfur cluster assembly factor [Candidatus Rokubacteria bacterium]|nr:metal-sulfur cluster assembly factor [Candidatus Rokubacteria bacterium]
MPDTDEILAALRHVIDPEIGIDVVELGLVYEARRQDGHVHVVMTMTTAACPLGESLTEEVKTMIRQHVPGVTSVSVDLVWEPPWQPSMMSASARQRLGWR